MSRTGSCQCGAVRIAASADPFVIRACWCRDCQKLSGGGATHNAFFKVEEVAVEGEVRWHVVRADSGNLLSRGFCPQCGNPLLARSNARPQFIGVRIGAFDDRDELGPQSVIWAASAPSWAHHDPDLPLSERQPPPLG
jgi:hypothetical protein